MRTKPPLCALPWFGGKVYMSRHLLPLFPSHKEYVEPFGGGGSVLLAKKPSQMETYNDLDSALADFFRVLSDPKLFEQFYRRVSPMLCSREIYSEYKNTWESYSDDIVERVFRWYVYARQSFAGMLGSWGYSIIAEKCKRIPAWINSIKRLPQIHARLQRVQIENRDFRWILKRYDGPNYLAYCDPPYVLSTRTGTEYKHEMSDEDHQELIKILLGYQGSVILSGYNSKLYSCLEQKGWERIDFSVSLHASKVTLGEKKGRRIESVWRNPKAVSTLAIPHQFRLKLF